MTKTIVHTYFQRMNPYKVTHDFSNEEMELFGAQIASYLSIRSPLEQKEGLLITYNYNNIIVITSLPILFSTEELKKLRNLLESHEKKIEELSTLSTTVE